MAPRGADPVAEIVIGELAEGAVGEDLGDELAAFVVFEAGGAPEGVGGTFKQVGGGGVGGAADRVGESGEVAEGVGVGGAQAARVVGEAFGGAVAQAVVEHLAEIVVGERLEGLVGVIDPGDPASGVPGERGDPAELVGFGEHEVEVVPGPTAGGRAAGDRQAVDRLWGWWAPGLLWFFNKSPIPYWIPVGQLECYSKYRPQHAANPPQSSLWLTHLSKYLSDLSAYYSSFHRPAKP